MCPFSCQKKWRHSWPFIWMIHDCFRFSHFYSRRVCFFLSLRRSIKRYRSVQSRFLKLCSFSYCVFFFPIFNSISFPLACVDWTNHVRNQKVWLFCGVKIQRTKNFRDIFLLLLALDFLFFCLHKDAFTLTPLLFFIIQGSLYFNATLWK